MTDAGQITLTDLIAFWGALTGTIATCWTIFSTYQDKGRLSVEAMIGRIAGNPSSTKKLMVIVTNTGRRPMVVTKIAGQYIEPTNGKKYFVLVPRELPKRLDESEYISEFIDNYQEVLALKRLYAIDSRGKEYNLPKKILRRLKDECEEIERK